MYIAKFFKIENGDWHFIVKLYKADYKDQALYNAERDWNENFKGWEMSFSPIKHFDSFNGVEIVEFSK